MKKILTIFISFLALGVVAPSQVAAQIFDVASTYQIVDDQTQPNDILVATEKGLERTDIPYDRKVFGVYQTQPLMVYRESPSPTTEETAAPKPIVRLGDAIVNVSDINGKIRPGDFITTSFVPGAGMKATQSGYVIGVATSEVTNTEATTVDGRQVNLGVVKVALRIEYAEIDRPRSFIRWLEYMNAALFRNIQEPERFVSMLRYMLAAMIGLAAILIGFFAFSRSLAKGVEAIGRNPLAYKSIQFSIALNLGLTVITTLIGLVLAIIILRL